MKSISRSLILLGLTVTSISSALACDCTAIFTPASNDRSTGWSAALTGQFTRFGTVWSGSREQPNPVDQYLESTVTQLALNYGFAGPWSVQVNLPWLHRTYLRPDHARIDRGRVTGLGDTTLTARFAPRLGTATEPSAFTFALLAGAKVPTGSDARLADAAAHRFHHHSNFPDNAVHDHDLALGSGSTDLVTGGEVHWRSGRWFARAQLQYTFRRPGSYAYRFGDGAWWEVSAGTRVTPAFTLQALFSGERKSKDTIGGAALVETGYSARFVGARVNFAFNSRWGADVSGEIPIRRRTTEWMIAPDYRLRAGVSCTL